MSQYFDDYSLPIKFNVHVNDVQIRNIFDQKEMNDWHIDIDDFYRGYFYILDAFIITGDETHYSFGGPLITDTTNDSIQEGE